MNPKYLKDLQRDAEAGDPSKQTELGKMYHDGEGVPRNYDAAERWFIKASNQGFVEAQFYFGKMLDEGKAGQDWSNPRQVKPFAETHILKAADEHGFAEAQLDLGEKLVEQKSYSEADKWLSVAAAQGSKAARKNIDKLEKKMPFEDVTEAQKDAASWLWRDENAK